MSVLLRTGLAIALLTLAACADTTGASTSTMSTTAATTAVAGPAGAASSATTSTSSAQSWVVSGRTTYAPADAPEEAISPDPNYDYGFVVQITPGAYHPLQLLSGCCRAITWKNLTGRPASVVFDHQHVDSGLIPPGGTFVWTPEHPVSFTYHSSVDPTMTGQVTVQQEFES